MNEGINFDESNVAICQTVRTELLLFAVMSLVRGISRAQGIFGTAARGLPARDLRGATRATSSGAPSTPWIATTAEADVAVVSMAHGRVNALSAEFMEAIAATVVATEKDPRFSAMVLTSALPSVFSAGLDITELVGLYGASEERVARFRRFWAAFQVCVCVCVCLRVYVCVCALERAPQSNGAARGCLRRSTRAPSP